MGATVHDDEIPIDAPLVSRLVAAQFPELERLPLRRVASEGTSNALFRLGEHLLVRLPRMSWAAQEPARQHRWLPVVARALEVEVPCFEGLGEPAEGYPHQWSVLRWIEGVHPRPEGPPEPAALASQLGDVLTALSRVEADGLGAGGRGTPLATRDAATRGAIAELADRYDARELTDAWEHALDAPVHGGPPAFFHGDLLAMNLLVRGGSLRAIIDFGSMGVGDPAVDLLPAWFVLPSHARERFRATCGADDARWERGRGWALSVALIQLPYYETRGPALAAGARRAIHELLASAD